jgi:hypothetical protein
MKWSSLVSAAMLCLATSVSGQSLSEIAKKEKERRKQNEEKGKEVRVITEADLNQGTSEATSPEETPATPSGIPSPTPGRRGAVTEEDIMEEREGEEGFSLDTEIPRDGSLQDRLRIFERLKKAHDAEAKRIDEQIAKNNARLEEIEQRLASIGAGGLPVVPQADRGTRHEGELIGLQNEKTDLQQQNAELEAEKKANAEGLREKGRRAGIPPGYLRF